MVAKDGFDTNYLLGALQLPLDYSDANKICIGLGRKNGWRILTGNVMLSLSLVLMSTGDLK